MSLSEQLDDFSLFNIRVTAAELSRCVEQILPDLLSKSGDSTTRVHNLAIHTILSLADAADVR